MSILWSGVLERSVEWSIGVESDFGLAQLGHSFAPRHTRTQQDSQIDCSLDPGHISRCEETL